MGNLMLISGSHNASIGNKPFTEKLESYKNNPLLKQQSEIKDIVSEVSKDEVVWKQSHIEKRFKKILSFALTRWNFNSVK